MRPSAVVTGVGGQDGVLLARHLVKRGYEVIGTVLPSAPMPLEPYLSGVRVVELDLRDSAGLAALLADRRPDELYNLAGVTSVAESEHQPDLALAVNARAVESMLDAVADVTPATKVFQASTAEVFGPDVENPQDEDTEHRPVGAYGRSKSIAHLAAAERRVEDGLFVSVGILYNHESPLRDKRFVTRKVTRAAAEIAAGRATHLTLGNVDVSRDWGAAKEYVVAMHAALQHSEPLDYVIATGRLHSIRQLVEHAFAAAGVDDAWSHVQQDPGLMRAGDPAGRCGDATRAHEVLGWRPSQSFEDMVAEMVHVDELRIRSGLEEAAEYLEAAGVPAYGCEDGENGTTSGLRDSGRLA